MTTFNVGDEVTCKYSQVPRKGRVLSIVETGDKFYCSELKRARLASNMVYITDIAPEFAFASVWLESVKKEASITLTVNMPEGYSPQELRDALVEKARSYEE